MVFEAARGLFWYGARNSELCSDGEDDTRASLALSCLRCHTSGRSSDQQQNNPEESCSNISQNQVLMSEDFQNYTALVVVVKCQWRDEQNSSCRTVNETRCAVAVF
ncbi:hypothetical protein AVEN_163775-1 [Araneus ventricosus]|uniref:Uncharacterized protein n=1 Tax=Araneus ventricosus TaxID=182803 RepID=A0A4Y2WTG1_ARAVE|nr:hypothetical protein AVEN_215586-1 [Araneus ventricosus]GBO40770.1 hypothetical protein AVEN_163775-1 [Araneus ventricosus]